MLFSAANPVAFFILTTAELPGSDGVLSRFFSGDSYLISCAHLNDSESKQESPVYKPIWLPGNQRSAAADMYGRLSS